MELYRCALCGNIALKLVDSGALMSCCGQPMELLKAGVTDAAQEKHVPALNLNGDTLSATVGDVLHPMTKEHYIQFILLHQGDCVHVKRLTPEDEPKAEFKIQPGVPLAVYEYCNLHGLWKRELG